MSKEKFEDKVQKIEENMKILESEDLDIEKMVEVYTETMNLAKDADGILQNAEAKINKIMDTSKDE